MKQMITGAILGCYISFSLIGCGEQATRLDDYSQLWVSDEQANPEVLVLGSGNANNLVNVDEYHEQKVLLTRPALAPAMEQQLQSHGYDVTLSSLASIFTEELKSPTKVPSDKVGKSYWLLGVRNTLFGTETDKTVELHMGDAGVEVLVLKKGGGLVASYFEEIDGEIAEYLWENN